MSGSFRVRCRGNGKAGLKKLAQNFTIKKEPFVADAVAILPAQTVDKKVPGVRGLGGIMKMMRRKKEELVSA